MKGKIVATTLILFVTTFVVSTAMAEEADAACSYARAAGTYGVSDSGTIVGIGPRAAVGRLTFDNARNMQGVATASLNGGISTTTLSGTYTVSPDCRGTATFNELDELGHLVLTAAVAIVWDNNMREARFIFTSVLLPDGTPLPTVVNGDARKLVP